MAAIDEKQKNQVRLKDTYGPLDSRMIIPSIRIKWKQEGRFAYEPNETAYSDYMNIRSLQRVQTNHPISYYEVDIISCKVITIGFCLEDYPMTKRPGRSRLRYQQPTVGFDTQGLLFLNGICEDGRGDVREKPSNIGCGYNLLNDTCFFTVDGEIKYTLEKVEFKDNMYFFVSFSQQGDEISVRKPGKTKFNIKSYADRILPSLLSSALKKDPKISKKNICDAVEEYLLEYGYNRTYNKMKHIEDKPEGEWLSSKEAIRKQLQANNFTLAISLTNSLKKYIRHKKRLIKTIRLLNLVCLIRKKKPLKDIFDFMSKSMISYKGEKLELFDRNGIASEVDMKQITADLMMRDRNTYEYDYCSKRTKQYLISQVMKEIGDRQPQYLATQTSIEKLLIHFRLLQRELEKDGLFPFARIV